MELYEDILAQALVKKLITPETAQTIVSDACYQALKHIKDILSDDTLDDPECFDRIEEIVCTLEALGTDAGGRHDFGRLHQQKTAQMGGFFAFLTVSAGEK